MQLLTLQISWTPGAFSSLGRLVTRFAKYPPSIIGMTTRQVEATEFHLREYPTVDDEHVQSPEEEETTATRFGVSTESNARPPRKHPQMSYSVAAGGFHTRARPNWLELGAEWAESRWARCRYY